MQADPPYVPSPPTAGRARAAKLLAITALALFVVDAAIVGLGMHREDAGPYVLALTCVAFVQFVVAILAIVFGAIARGRGGSGLPLVAGIVSTVGAVAAWLGGAFLIAITEVWKFTTTTGGGGWGGGAWGRPLRIRGRQLHPELTAGADWTAGPRPDPAALDESTRRALEALWLHDAQKEHASVPAFSRVSWLLAAAGAPAELMTWAHRAAIEEVEHAQACFALAAGYGGRSFTVEPMPDLLLGGLDGKVDPRITLAIESLSDGCQLEDYNADVAGACAEVCREPVTRGVLDTIAREERGHAELSWAILGWLVEHHRDVVAAALATAAADLDRYPRPTAVSAQHRALVDAASEPALRAHGRLPDARWAELWTARRSATRRRLADLLAAAPARAAA